MSDAGLVPYEYPYSAQLQRIRRLLDDAVPVLVVHNEFATRKELVITPESSMAGGFGRPALSSGVWWHLSWTNTGSMWVPAPQRFQFESDFIIDASYVAEKMDIRKWPDDARSIAAMLRTLTTGIVVKAEEV